MILAALRGLPADLGLTTPDRFSFSDDAGSEHGDGAIPFVRDDGQVVGPCGVAGGGGSWDPAPGDVAGCGGPCRRDGFFEQIWVKACFRLLPKPAMAVLSTSFPS